MANALQLSAEVTEEEPLRYSPSGVAVLQIWLKHDSEQQQLGITRQVNCVIQAVLIGQEAERLAGQLHNKTIEAEGFVAKRSLSSARLVFHIQQLKLM